MLKLLRKFFIPHEVNNYHPYSTRHHTFFTYALLLLLLNFAIFPALGLNNNKAQASALDTKKIVELANKERKAAGLNPLTLNENLVKAATEKGGDMFAKQYWNHIGPNGETPWQFITKNSYQYIYAGENLAKDFSSNEDVHLAWMNSPTHKQNIMNANFKDIGVAIVKGDLNKEETTLIVVMFGTPLSEVVNGSGNNQGALKTPSITHPADNSVFETKNVNLKGIAESGDTIRVYANNTIIGELPKDSVNFSINVDLQNHDNKVYIKSKDTLTDRESEASNAVNIKITQIPATLGTTTEKESRNIFSSLSTNQIINLSLLAVIVLITSVDLFVLIRRGIRREHSSHHSLHIALLAITAIGIFTVL